MGTRTEIRKPLAWQSTLGAMKKYGTRLALACTAPGCSAWITLDIDQLLAERGEDFMLWDRGAPCPQCGVQSHYMASPGRATPFLPLKGGVTADIVRQSFLRSLGLTPRDIVRIKAMAEATTANDAPEALNDLDVPYRIGACWPGDESRTSGRWIGTWAGRSLLLWEMNPPERDRWAQRPRGPRRIG